MRAVLKTGFTETTVTKIDTSTYPVSWFSEKCISFKNALSFKDKGDFALSLVDGSCSFKCWHVPLTSNLDEFGLDSLGQ